MWEQLRKKPKVNILDTLFGGKTHGEIRQTRTFKRLSIDVVQAKIELDIPKGPKRQKYSKTGIKSLAKKEQNNVHGDSADIDQERNLGVIVNKTKEKKEEGENELNNRFGGKLS